LGVTEENFGAAAAHEARVAGSGLVEPANGFEMIRGEHDAGRYSLLHKHVPDSCNALQSAPFPRDQGLTHETKGLMMDRRRAAGVLLGTALFLSGCDLLDSGLLPSSRGGSGSSASAQPPSDPPTTTQVDGIPNQVFLPGSPGATSAAQFSTGNLQHYYLGVSKPLSPIDQEQLMVYRDQLEMQQRALQLQQYRGTSGPIFPINPTGARINPATVSRSLSETQNELDRVNGLLNSPVANPTYSPTPLSGTSGIPPSGFSSMGAGAPPVFK
jgi:hypothetical protein